MELTTAQALIYLAAAMCNIFTGFQLLRALNRAERNSARMLWLLESLGKLDTASASAEARLEGEIS